MSDTTLTEAPANNTAGISLEALLAAKERRAARQQALLARYGMTLVSLTLVTPGPVKDSALYRRGMRAAVTAFATLVQARGWTVREQQLHWLATGAEGFWVVDKDALTVKAATTALEEQHPLGRVWDFDVFCPREGSVSRGMLAYPKRACVLCGEPAHACARSRRHPLPDVIARIEALLHGHVDTE
ncbi:citrate lyase holo-[acyl-carrier protein] synthase [Musicola paradisiaca]|uniref:Apo-citrate lyase phosphoribosyl-dephospho-CoA transferase n=1 Tax=Musicola paradisiaca (strain Ech703) TaxID=579405 RepID=C6C7R1_MUSP7|nr:citrate lyase holo-[acyl-carrier protein] synthase [Musicola paradisiaca]ACS86003.1 holo-ACP synthase CitX [Musicola paradisiaca Ech703]